MPSSSKKVIYYFEDSDPKEPDERLLKKMKPPDLMAVATISIERWRDDMKDPSTELIALIKEIARRWTQDTEEP